MVMPVRAIGSAIVYEAKNLANGHRYFGFTSQGLPRREWQHRVQARSKRPGGYILTKALRRYGDQNFVFSVLADFDGDEDLALAYEAEMIAKWVPEYNIYPGGSGGAMPPETRRKISEANKGRLSPLRGVPLSDAHREAIRKGKLGKPRSPEEQERLRTLATGRKDSPEVSARKSAALKLAGTRNKAVKCIEDGRVFRSARAADEFYGFMHGRVSHAASKKASTHGLHFVYVEGAT
jgi:group I intron endonuclease